MKSWEEIHSIVQARRRADASLVRQMRMITDHYHGDVVIPLPDVIGEPDLPPLMPQLIHDAIESNAMKANGPAPDLDVPAVDPFDGASVERARNRRRVFKARWFDSQLELLMGRAYRHGVAYGTWHFLVSPDYERGGARIGLRNPLTAYPELRDENEVREPLNVAYISGRSPEWLAAMYPELRQMIADISDKHIDSLWDVCEWVDNDHVVLGTLGPRLALNEPIENFVGKELSRHPNLAGMVPAVSPRRLTLARIAGQMDQMVGMVDWMGRLMALDVIAAEKATFPDLVAIGEEGRPPDLAGGRWKDGRTGDINQVVAKDVKVIRTEPGQMSGMMMDRIERAARFSGGIPAVSGGELTGAIRSGRVVDSMAAFSIDPRIAELQTIMARALACVNSAVAAVEQGCFPNKTFTVFSGWSGDAGHVEYSPTKLFAESAHSVVNYPMPGADVSSISVAVAQLSGAGLTSKKSARKLHPYIDDPEAEEYAIEVERLDEAILVSLQQGAQAGTVPFVDLARIAEKRRDGKSLIEAVTETQAEAQARQAATAPEPQAGQAVPPEMMPGLNMPGAGVEGQPPEGPPAIQRPYKSLDNLDHLLETLRGGPGGG